MRSGFGFDQRRRKPRQDRRHSSQQFLVDHGGLREVRHFGRSARINQRRQQVVLHHRTKQHIRIEILRRRFNPVQQLFPRDSFLTHCELAVAVAVAAIIRRRTTVRAPFFTSNSSVVADVTFTCW